jgi:hypothetical protein
MLNYSASRIDSLSAHRVGNKTLGEPLHLSKAKLELTDEKLDELLLKYFLSHFTIPEFYGFTFSNGDFKMNPLYKYIREVFEQGSSLHLQSIQIAQHLYENALHPNIKPGDLYVARFSVVAGKGLLNAIDDISEGEEIDAIGIFKSETKDFFLKLKEGGEGYEMAYDDGINIEKLDKGCLIFNTAANEGYKVLILDKSSKGNDAQYWKNNFLNLKPLADDYHHTANFLGLTKNFVSNRLSEEFEVTPADQASYLNRSMDYFKKNTEFDEEEFAGQVFNDSAVIESFKNFKTGFMDEKGLEMEGQFSISDAAIKKQSRNFKSILKLDKNFHIYIHGDKELIERGTDANGRKFYKIYFEKEE